MGTAKTICTTCLLLTVSAPLALAQSADGGRLAPLFTSVDLAIGEQATVTLTDGSTARVQLLGVECERDRVRGAVRKSTVRLELNGAELELVAGMYRLPRSLADIDLQIDCPVTSDYLEQSSKRNVWALDKDARIRIWPGKRSPWVRPGTFGYPTPTLRWFATDTQMANDPCYVDAGETAANRNIYYHYGLDIGGAEAMTPVVAATDGVVISARGKVVEGFDLDGTQVSPRGDVVYIADARGWHYRYSHLHSIDDAIRPGKKIRKGDPIGVLGKEGASGGWSHLHFGVSAPQPSGRYGALEAYALLWQAYREMHPTVLQAVARPHVLIAPGETATLDGSRSYCDPTAVRPVPVESDTSNHIVRYAWTLTDGTTAEGPVIKRRYDKPGTYSEVLKVTDGHGNIDYDFAVVQVVDPARPDAMPPTIHAAYYPNFGIKAGDPVTFKVRSFAIRPDDGHETWDFGDGTPRVVVQSDGCQKALNPDGYAVTTHSFERPGHYLVTVHRTNSRGETARAHLHVRVEE